MLSLLLGATGRLAPVKRLLFGQSSAAAAVTTSSLLHSYSKSVSASAPWTLLDTYTHDRKAFTQGLVFHDGMLLESTGLWGESTLRRVEPTTGRVTQRIDLDKHLFGEGIAVVGSRIIMLTWKAGVGHVYDVDTFDLLRTFRFKTNRKEGWGIAYNGDDMLVVSDGSDVLHFWDPDTLAETRRVKVRGPRGQPIRQLNELEFVEGELFANVWFADHVVRIDPNTGRAIGALDLNPLNPRDRRPDSEDVLNGIAYDAATQQLWITGKLWHHMYKLQLNGARMSPPLLRRRHAA